MQTTLRSSRFRKTAAALTCAAALVCWKPKVERMAHAGDAPAAKTQKQSAPDPEGMKRRVEALINQLDSTDGLEISSAEGELVAMGPSVIPMLLEAMPKAMKKKSEQPVQLMRAIVELGEPGARELIKCLRHKDDMVRMCAILMLDAVRRTKNFGPGGETVAAAALVERLDDPNPRVRAAASETLQNFRKSAGATEKSGKTGPSGVNALSAMGARGAPKLVSLMDDADSDTRRAARSALMKMEGAAVPALLAGLNSRKLEVQIACAEVLGETGGERAIKPLIRLVPKGDHRLRAAAAEALGVIGDKKAMPALIKAANDKDELVQKTAIAAMLRIDPSSIH